MGKVEFIFIGFSPPFWIWAIYELAFSKKKNTPIQTVGFAAIIFFTITTIIILALTP